MLRRLAAAGGEDTKSFLPSNFTGLVAMPWVLSKGTIAWAGVQTQFQAGQSPGVHIVFDANMPGTSQLSEVTNEVFCNSFGLQKGDQLTLIAFPKRTDIDESACLEPIISRIILCPQSSFSEDSMFNESGHVVDSNPLNENDQAFTFAFATGRLSASITNREFIGAAAIISRKASDGSWKRSASVMEYSAVQQDGGYTLRQASMVISTEIVTDSDWYLNNANEIAPES